MRRHTLRRVLAAGARPWTPQEHERVTNALARFTEWADPGWDPDAPRTGRLLVPLPVIARQRRRAHWTAQPITVALTLLGGYLCAAVILAALVYIVTGDVPEDTTGLWRTVLVWGTPALAGVLAGLWLWTRHSGAHRLRRTHDFAAQTELSAQSTETAQRARVRAMLNLPAAILPGRRQ